MHHTKFRVCLAFISYIRQEDGDLRYLLSEDYLLCLTDLKKTKKEYRIGTFKVQILFSAICNLYSEEIMSHSASVLN